MHWSGADGGTPTSASTAFIAAAAPKLMSGVRPGFCSGTVWMRPSRYVAIPDHADACSCDDGAGCCTPIALLPTSRRHTSSSPMSTYIERLAGTR